MRIRWSYSKYAECPWTRLGECETAKDRPYPSQQFHAIWKAAQYRAIASHFNLPHSAVTAEKWWKAKLPGVHWFTHYANGTSLSPVRETGICVETDTPNVHFIDVMHMLRMSCTQVDILCMYSSEVP